MDAAVVEDQIHTGKLLPCLLRLQVQFYYTLVTYKQSQHTLFMSDNLPVDIYTVMIV